MRSLMARTLLALCLGASSYLLAEPYFVRKDLPSGPSPVFVVAGDFNGDHRPDLAVVTVNDGVFILLNAGGDNFRPAIRAEAVSATEVFWPDAFAGAFDFNGDGKDDLVTSSGVFLSRGDGTFQPAFLAEATGVDRDSIKAAGDFNRDGKLDLVVNSFQKGAIVWLGSGDGTFRSGAKVIGPRPASMQWVLVADFNRDGRLDLATLGQGYEVFLGNGDGTFSDPIDTNPLVAGPDPVGIPWDAFLAADFNGDGIPDLALMSRILLSKGSGTFQPPPLNSIGEGNYRIFAAADFTGDGRADLIVGDATSVSVLPGNGDGTFAPALARQSAGSDPYPPAAVADFDGDGRLDLAVANRGSNSVSILLSSAQAGPAPRRAVSSATGLAAVAPESLATLYAPTTANASLSASPPWPAHLGNISLEVRDSDGVTRAAPLLYVSPTQINFQVPAGTALGEATLSIVDDRGTTGTAGAMQVEPTAPGLFTVAPGTPAAYGIRAEANGSTQVPIPVYACVPSTAGVFCDAAPIPLSAAGDLPIYVSFFGTGFRGTNPEKVTCSVNSVPGPVVYAGSQGTPGVDLIVIRLLPNILERRSPAEVQYLGEAKPVIIQIDGVPANWVWIVVR